MVDGQLKTLLVHRKGSTRAFPPHHPLIPVDYQLTGQPVLIGGTMGTCSYVLTGGSGRSRLDTAGAGAGHTMLTRRGPPSTLCASSPRSSPAAPAPLPNPPTPGTEKGMEETFGSTCHGAGRARSRNNSRNNMLDYQHVGAGSQPCCCRRCPSSRRRRVCQLRPAVD